MSLEDIITAVGSIAGKYGIKRAILFGSRANGTARPDSDVDLIVEFKDSVTLLTLALVTQELEKLLSTHVDVIHGPVTSADLIEPDKEIEIYAA